MEERRKISQKVIMLGVGFLALTLIISLAILLKNKDSNVPNTNENHTHLYVASWETLKLSTCTEEGLIARYCSCGDKQTTPIAAKGHRFGEWEITTEPTCTEEGRMKRCCSCGEEEISKVAAKGHVNGAWIIDKQATCTDNGSQHQICSACSITLKTESIPSDGGHSCVSKITSPTPTTKGLTVVSCTKCSQIIFSEEWEPITISVSIVEYADTGKYLLTKLQPQGGRIIYENEEKKMPQYTITLTNLIQTQDSIIYQNVPLCFCEPLDGSAPYYMADSHYLYFENESFYKVTISDGLNEYVITKIKFLY